MARIRSIKPEYWSSEQVMNCSRDARLLFIGMWNFADDEGRIACSEKTLRAQIFPGDLDVDEASIRRWLDELSSNDLLLVYGVSGRRYISITGWKHQKIDRRRESKIPPPSGVVEGSSNIRRDVAPDLNRSDLNRSDPIGKNLSKGEPEAEKPKSIKSVVSCETGEGAPSQAPADDLSIPEYLQRPTERKTPRHGAKSKCGQWIYFKHGTAEFEAHMVDYREAFGTDGNATADGRWFKMTGEVVSKLMAGGKY